jgi:hypothetical protein
MLLVPEAVSFLGTTSHKLFFKSGGETFNNITTLSNAGIKTLLVQLQLAIV